MAVTAGDLRVHEESRHRRVPRQLDAVAGGDRKSYVDDRSVEVIRANLTGAKYTLAVPAYTYEAGLGSFADIQRFATELNHSLYGIEPGNDGNRLMLGMLRQNLFGLGNFKLIESSEQHDRPVRTHGALDFGQHSGRIGHRNVRLCDEFGSAERRWGCRATTHF